jgi:gamma-glutamyltranspeptidase / glutathione hydrolase / leukotriene-C4 hydrolase
MDDFSTPNTSNFFGLPPSVANYIAPGKRPLSSMTPTIVTANDQLSLVLGASGGSKIPTATMQTLINYVSYDWPLAKAVGMQRLHDQLLPDILYLEEGFPRSWQNAFAQMQYNVRVDNDSDYLGQVNAVAHSLFTNRLDAVTDGRRPGSAPDGY